MNTVRSRPATSRPQTTNPTNLALRSSTANWFAGWKARKTAAPTPAAASQPAPADDAAAALARWLTGDSK
jgi:hypothetical protein